MPSGSLGMIVHHRPPATAEVEVYIVCNETPYTQTGQPSHRRTSDEFAICTIAPLWCILVL